MGITKVLTTEEVNEIVRLFNLGMGKVSISKETNIGEMVIRRILRENGLSRPKHTQTSWSKNKISNQNKGRFKGNKSPCFGKKLSVETKAKISKNRKGKNKGKNNSLFGKKGKDHPCFGRENKWGKHTQEAKNKISKAFTGSNHPNWKGAELL